MTVSDRQAGLDGTGMGVHGGILDTPLAEVQEVHPDVSRGDVNRMPHPILSEELEEVAEDIAVVLQGAGGATGSLEVQSKEIESLL